MQVKHFTVFVQIKLIANTTGKQKLQSKANSRKSKSPNPGQAYAAAAQAAGGERPSSVSSVHSEGDYHQQATGWAWEDRPSSTGKTQDTFKLWVSVYLSVYTIPHY